MRLNLLLLIWLCSFSTYAAVVDGRIVYKLSDGNLVEREVRLEVPSRGIGEVVLSGNSFEWRTENFWTVKKSGQIQFYAAFKTEFMQKQSTMVLKGTYLKGENKIMYYGNLFKRKGHHDLTDSESLENFSFVGGFNFDYLR